MKLCLAECSLIGGGSVRLILGVRSWAIVLTRIYYSRQHEGYLADCSGPLQDELGRQKG